MSCTSDYQPLWRPQNPALSGDKNGWLNCAAYVGGYSADYATCGVKQPTGAYIRSLTNEPIPDPASPGLTINQVADALARIGVSVTPFVRYTWGTVAELVDAGHFVSLCVAYSVIRPTVYSGDRYFNGGHQIGVPPGWDAMDPLCDGRRSDIYKYHGAVYPQSLLKSAAGAFRVIRNGVSQPIGFGYAQGFYTIAHPAPGTVPISGGDMAIATAGIKLNSGYVIDLPQGQPFYEMPSLTSRVLTKLSVAGAVLFTGHPTNGGWSTVLVNTGAPYSDGIARPTQVYVPLTAGKPRPK